MSHSHPGDPQPWTVLESQYRFRKPPWLTMRQDRVQLPGGGIVEEYYVWEYPTWINVIAVTKERRIVLIRQYRYALGQVHYEIPAGVADAADGDLEAAARRELLEETGFGGGQWRHWMVLSANPALQTNLTHTFLATDVEQLQPPNPEATEEITVHLVTIEEVRRIILAGEMVQALHAAPLLKFLAFGS
jgi:8-oxo-dGDP phosphatase